MRCPNCGGSDITSMAETTTNTTQNTKGFGTFKACCGFLLFGWVGILCGLCGMGKTTSRVTHHTKVVNVCKSCGKRF